ncbi:phosphate signaling complex protein PhoU [Metabacillus fastidiosus]|uniref:Phosphate-specific transport system accessory protein PhoU n=1 Tax=Metabacillus fastidiosus TaxID=1458 RepID=A0ABU6NX16_9BACI|nr:phosphate signaling complex protein PhoU [Metabacillus fastidiosus]MED4400937.1 phosphate signaling complex protein PhoU [Metabacillus fastidiosus]MED4453486.1 phosphate signaling complex protein PhoU [Metabacillus fastidiosus]MED4530719.1 phosphate signaling complex protein PhoU [Metabacillus fastidiosus]
MIVRENFENELNLLRQKLIEISSLTEIALSKAINALEKQNIEEALYIIEEDTRIDNLEEEINDLAILLIAKQQPVAIDLRRIIVAIKIATDIERIADFAVNIAKATIRIGKEPLIQPVHTIKRMHEIVLRMLSLVIQAYNEEDVVLAKEAADMDDEVDELYGQVIRELLKLMADEQENFNQINQFLFVCRYIERAGDHITNVSESVLYLVKGKRYGLNV